MNKKTAFQQAPAAARLRPGLGWCPPALISALVSAGPVLAGPAGDMADTPPPSEPAGKLSVLDAVPGQFATFKRYPKSYGDPNMDRATVDGPLLDRQYLFGSLWGTRDSLADHGLMVDLGVTQVYQGAVSGDGDGGRYSGSVDLWAALDTGRANLWPGGMIYGHFESNWGETVTGTGGLLPVNMDTTMPRGPSSMALSELFILQALPKGWGIVAGKIDWTSFADKSFFANDERTQFLHTGLKNNPILGSYVPYTAMGGAISKQFNEEWSAALIASSTTTEASSPGFDTLSATDFTYGLAINWDPKFGDLPGHYAFLGGYTPADQVNYNIDPRHLLEEVVGKIPVITKDGNWAATFVANQYLWADPHTKRHDGSPVGLGVFARYGFGPKDRSVIDQFYSFGFGGFGGPFGRVNDSWGIGWAGTHISSDLRKDADVLGFDVEAFEHVIEVFYNICLTPAAYLSLDAQYIDSANGASDESVLLGMRLQLDF